jgi:hypothetical protein
MNESNTAIIICKWKNAADRASSPDILTALLTAFESILVCQTTPNKN